MDFGVEIAEHDFATLACKVQRLKQIALGDAATSPDNAPPLEQEASFAFAPATQPWRPVDESEDEDDEGDAGEVDMEPPEEPAEHLAQPPQPPQPMDAEPAALTLRDVRASDYGFVDNGLSVQPDGLHSRHSTDRAILKQTLLTGKPKVTCKEACDKMRSFRHAGRKALPKEKWTAVMAAAAGQHPNLLRLEGETLCLHAQVIPDTSDGKVRYHNDLMKACGLTLRELIAAMNKTTEASEKSEQDRRAKRTRDE